MDTSQPKHMLPNGLAERGGDPHRAIFAATAGSSSGHSQMEGFLCPASGSTSDCGGTDSRLEYPPNPPPANRQPSPQLSPPVIGCHFDQFSHLSKHIHDKGQESDSQKIDDFSISSLTDLSGETDHSSSSGVHQFSSLFGQISQEYAPY